MLWKTLKVTSVSLFLLIAVVALSADVVMAQTKTELKLAVPLPGQGGVVNFTCDTESGQVCQFNQLATYIGHLYQFGVGLAVLLSILMIMVGGTLWLLSAGNQSRIGTAKDFIGSALVGLFLAIFSYVLLYTINPNLISLKPLALDAIVSIPLPQAADTICCQDTTRPGQYHWVTTETCEGSNPNYRQAPRNVCESSSLSQLKGCCQVKVIRNNYPDSQYCRNEYTKTECDSFVDSLASGYGFTAYDVKKDFFVKRPNFNLSCEEVTGTLLTIQKCILVASAGANATADGGSVPLCDTSTSGICRYPGESASDAIARVARDSVGEPLGVCALTEGGRKGCAVAVNAIVEEALGLPVGGGASTAAMYEALRNSDRFTAVNRIANAVPGDIIISPTDDSGGGHVGICNTDGCSSIISNSSSRGRVLVNYSSSTWVRDFGEYHIYHAK